MELAYKMSQNIRTDKVALISPPSRSFNHYRPPLALIYLAGYLEKHGIKTEVVDILADKQVRDKKFYADREGVLLTIKKIILSRVKKINPDIVGITCYTPEYEETIELAKEIKENNPKVKIIVGGVHPSLYPQDFCFLESPADVVVIGEGEQTLLELVKIIREGGNLDQVKGIAYYDKINKKIIITEKRDFCQNLDEISFPAYEKIDMDYYTTANPYAIRGVFLRSMYIVYSRGCPSQCTFCVSKKLRCLNGTNKYVRLRSADNVFEEINYLKKNYKIDSFYFVDDLFTIDKEKVKAFCRLLINQICFGVATRK